MERWIGHPPGMTDAVQPSESTGARGHLGCRSGLSAGVVRYIPPMAQPPAGDYPLGNDGLPDLPLRVLEDDENIPPRPEEELADLERTDPPAGPGDITPG